jgi:uncharacterized protein (DUF305 family)
MKKISARHSAGLYAATALLLLSTYAQGQQAASAPDAMPAGMHMEMAQPDPDSMPSTQAYRAGSAAMMKGMDAPYTGNADQDFVAHMLPHHEGAVNMAKVELQFGTDPELRKLARAIVKAQDQEIAVMEKWQTHHPAR